MASTSHYFTLDNGVAVAVFFNEETPDKFNVYTTYSFKEGDFVEGVDGQDMLEFIEKMGAKLT